MIPGQLATTSQPCPGACGREDTRLYACGWRCPDHTPARLAGNPEPDVARYCAPGRCYCTDPACAAIRSLPTPAAKTITDFRIAAAGKKTVTAAVKREAQAQIRQSRQKGAA